MQEISSLKVRRLRSSKETNHDEHERESPRPQRHWTMVPMTLNKVSNVNYINSIQSCIRQLINKRGCALPTMLGPPSAARCVPFQGCWTKPSCGDPDQGPKPSGSGIILSRIQGSAVSKSDNYTKSKSGRYQFRPHGFLLYSRVSTSRGAECECETVAWPANAMIFSRIWMRRNKRWLFLVLFN